MKDPRNIVGTTINNTYILSYEGKTQSGTDQYKIRFPSGNITTKTITTIKKGAVDIENKKATTKKIYVNKTKEKGLSTIAREDYEINGYINPNTDIILVLDQATYSTGWCIIDKGKITKYGKISQNSQETFKRIYLLVEDIHKLVTLHNVNSIIIEDVYLGYSPKTYAILCNIIGAIAYYSIKNNISLLATPYSVWSNRIGLKGKREQLKVQSLEKAIQIIGRELFSNDVSDAILIAHSYLKSKGIVEQSIEW